MSDSEKSTEEPKEIQKLQNVKKLVDLKLDHLELLRGETPEDIETKCLNKCKDYLSGNWRHQTVQTVTIKRISGGMMNQIYYCAINEPDQSEIVPQEVAVRFYGTNTFVEQDNNLRDIIISVKFSENKIGPKLYGVFEGGLIQKYYPHRQFKKEEQSNPVLVEKVFKTLARVHSLDIPIKKSHSIHTKMEECYQLAYKRFPIEKEMDEYNCETLKKTDLRAEFIWIKKVIDKINCPIVFTHKDYRSSNLLITEPNDDLVVCDFDLSGYGYRGSDFITLLREFCSEKVELKVLDKFPLEESIIVPLIEIYVKESVGINGKIYTQNEINSVENILKEIKIFYLYSQLFAITIMFKNDHDAGEFPMTRSLCMEMAELCIKNYLFGKQYLIEQNIIQL